MKQFDALIVPTEDFNSSSCFIYSNQTDYCPETDLDNCHQCIIVMDYIQNIDICAVCPSGPHIQNFLGYQTIHYLDNRTESSYVRIICQTTDRCNSIENIERVKQNLAHSFDYDKFFSSTASSLKLTLSILLAVCFIFSFY